MFDDHFIKMDIVNHNSFIVIGDIDGLVDHSAAPADHFADLFDLLADPFGRLGCDAGLVYDYFELAAGAFVENFAVLIDLADLLAGHPDLPDYMTVLVGLLVDPSGLVDYFASLCFAIFANGFAPVELAAAVVDVFAV